jgi:hypothetical protein
MFNDLFSNFNLMLLDADDGGSGGSSSDDDKKNDKKDDGADDKQSDKKDDKDARTVTMTQDELDALIAREKGRVKGKFSDYDDVKAKLTEYEKAEEERKKAAMSEHERLEAEKSEALKKVEEAEGKSQQALEKANQRLIKADFRVLARELNIRADAVDDAYKLADLSSVKVDDEGNVKGVQDAIKSLIEAKSFLVEQQKKESKKIGDSSNYNEDKSQKTSEQLLKEASEKARKTGKPEDKVAYAKLKRELN